MLFADFLKRLMPVAQSHPAYKEHFPPSSWKRLFDTARPYGDDGLVFEVGAIVDSGLGDGRIEEVVVPFVRDLNGEFAPGWETREADEPVEDPWTSDAWASEASEEAQHAPSSSAVEPEEPRVPEAVVAPTAEAAAADVAEPAADLLEERWIFPQYDYSREDLAVPLPDVDIQELPGGVLQYSWPDPGEGELYRVTTSDHEALFSPEEADAELVACWAPNAQDARTSATSLRFVTVWGYRVIDANAGILGQPRKVAEGIRIQQLQGWTVEFIPSERKVFSRWEAPALPSHVRANVRTARLPLDEPIARYLRGQSWLRSQFEVPNNGHGFQDADLEPGRRHTYVAALEVEIDGTTRLSAPQRFDVTPVAEPDRIEDLVVESRTRDHREELRLAWSQQRGTRMSFYRTTSPAHPEAVSRGRVPASQLSAAGLEPQAIIRNIAGRTGETLQNGRERWVLEGLEWPEGREWDTLHLTPVTIIDQDDVLIGAPRQLRRAGRIEDVRLVQRMNWQLVTFAWPGEAVAVELRIGYVDAEPDLRTQRLATVEKTAYEREGGFRIDSGLPPQGCRLFLTAVTHFEGRRISSEPTIAVIEPLWGYQYEIQWPRWRGSAGKGLFSRATSMFGQGAAEVTISARVGVCPEEELPELVLLHNPDRLPLHSTDGTRIDLLAEKPGGQVQPQPMKVLRAPSSGVRSVWFDHAGPGPGWYRLMVDARPASTLSAEERRTALERYALADPDLAVLDRRR